MPQHTYQCRIVSTSPGPSLLAHLDEIHGVSRQERIGTALNFKVPQKSQFGNRRERLSLC